MSRKVNTFYVKDADVLAFLAATGITDGAITAALYALVATMKSDGTWSMLTGIYPMVGGTATTHKFNLKNPADTDAAFRLSFQGGWTHGSNGATPNGTNAYARTFWTPSVHATINGCNFGIYSRTNNTSGTKAYGCGSGTVYCENNFSAGQILVGAGATVVTYTASPSTRFMFARRSGLNLFQAYRDTSSLGTSTATGALATPEFYFGAYNNAGTAAFFTVHEIGFGVISGSAMTHTDAVALNGAINTFVTTLGRNV